MSPLDKILAIVHADAPPPVAPLDFAIPEERPATAAAFAASVGEFFEAASDEEAQAAALWLMGFTRSLAEGLALEVKAVAPATERRFADPAGNLYDASGAPIPDPLPPFDPPTPETDEPGSDVSCAPHDES